MIICTFNHDGSKVAKNITHR